jgi:hypothetical protein
MSVCFDNRKLFWQFLCPVFGDRNRPQFYEELTNTCEEDKTTSHRTLSNTASFSIPHENLTYKLITPPVRILCEVLKHNSIFNHNCQFLPPKPRTAERSRVNDVLFQPARVWMNFLPHVISVLIIYYLIFCKCSRPLRTTFMHLLQKRIGINWNLCEKRQNALTKIGCRSHSYSTITP